MCVSLAHVTSSIKFWTSIQPIYYSHPVEAANTAAALEYCLTHPQWRLSVQTHKYIGVR